jgi:hypothetical protein
VSPLLHIDTDQVSAISAQIESFLAQLEEASGLLSVDVSKIAWASAGRDQYVTDFQNLILRLTLMIEQGHSLSDRLFKLTEAWERVAALFEGAAYYNATTYLATPQEAGFSVGGGWNFTTVIPIPISYDFVWRDWLGAIPTWVQKKVAPLFERNIVNPLPYILWETTKKPAISFGDLMNNMKPGDIIYEVPHELQGNIWRGYGCAPTSASMITEYFHNLNTAHKRVSPEIMASMVSSGQPQGIPIPDMTDELQQLGYSMIQKNNATMDDLTNALQSGPVLVNVFTGKFHHAVVVSGIKTDGSLVLNDPLEKADVIFSGSEFLREWDAGGNYLYVIRPE